jgi:hypothetical protein
MLKFKHVKSLNILVNKVRQMLNSNFLNICKLGGGGVCSIGC